MSIHRFIKQLLRFIVIYCHLFKFIDIHLYNIHQVEMNVNFVYEELIEDSLIVSQCFLAINEYLVLQ